MKRKKLLIVAVIGLLIVAGTVAFAMYRIGNKPYVGPKMETNFGQAKAKAKKVPDIKFRGATNLLVDSATNTTYAELTNPKGNPCFFRFELSLTDSGEVLYQSDFIKPGQTIKSAELRKKLKVGTYEGKLHIKTKSTEAPFNEMNGMVTAVKIIVE